MPESSARGEMILDETSCAVMKIACGECGDGGKPDALARKMKFIK